MFLLACVVMICITLCVIALQLTSISSYLLCSGEAIIAFATPTESNNEDDDELVKELRLMVRTEIGPFAAPDVICIVSTPSLFHSSAWLHLFFNLLLFFVCSPFSDALSSYDEIRQDHAKSIEKDLCWRSRSTWRCQHAGRSKCS